MKKIRIEFAKGENTLHTYEFLTDNEERDEYILTHMLRRKDGPAKIRKANSMCITTCEDTFIYPDGDITSTAIGNYLFEHKEKVLAFEAVTNTGDKIHAFAMPEYAIYEMHRFAMQFVQSLWIQNIKTDYGIPKEYKSIGKVDEFFPKSKYDDGFQRKWDSLFYNGRLK